MPQKVFSLLLLLAAWQFCPAQVPAVSAAWSTFVGGAGSQYGGFLYDIALDPEGNIVGVGAFEAGFPVTPAAWDTTFGGGSGAGPGGLQAADAVVFKLDKTGSQLLWATYLGGSRADAAVAVKVAPNGNIFVAGNTTSPDFPTSADAFQNTHGDGNLGNYDVFLAILSPDGDSLLHASLYGGLGDDYAGDLDLGSDDEVAVTGYTNGGNVPVSPNAFDQSFNGAIGFSDIFVFKSNSTASQLLYSTYIGGSESETGIAIQLNAQGEAVITGEVNSFDFPTTPGALYENKTGLGASAYMARLSNDGSQLLACTYLAGNRGDYAEALVLSHEEEVWIAGRTYSDIFPLSPDAIDDSHNGDADIFLARISAAGDSLQYASYYGGSSREICTDMALNAQGELFLVGNTVSPDFPTTDCSTDSTWNGGSLYWGGDAFLLKFDASGTRLLYSSFWGGTANESTPAIAMDPADCPGSVVLGMTTGSNDFPTTPGAYMETKPPNDQFGITRLGESLQVKITLPADSCPQTGAAFPLGYEVLDCGHWTDLSALQWDFGDGSGRLDSATSHVYTQNGDYLVGLSLPGCTERLDTVGLGLFGLDLGPDLDLCRGEKAWLDGRVAQAQTYRWQDGGTEALREVDREGLWWLEVTDARGCTASDSVVVQLLGEGDIVPPNVFSPNGDGINDAFLISGLEDKRFALLVYDRWGTLVHEDPAYNNDWAGRDLPEGTYYYILESPDRCGRYMGSVTLIR